MVLVSVAQDDDIDFFQVNTHQVGIMLRRDARPGIKQYPAFICFYQNAQSPLGQVSNGTGGVFTQSNDSSFYSYPSLASLLPIIAYLWDGINMLRAVVQ
jgi:hypothetical protein